MSTEKIQPVAPIHGVVITRFAMSGHEELVPRDVAQCPYCGDRVLCAFDENEEGCRPSNRWRCVSGCERKRFDIARNEETLRNVSRWAKSQPVRVYGHCDSDGKHHRVWPAEKRLCPKCNGVARVDCGCACGDCSCKPWRDGAIWCDWCELGQSQKRIDMATITNASS